MPERTRAVICTFNTNFVRGEEASPYSDEPEWGTGSFDNVVTYIKSLFSNIGENGIFTECAAAWECGTEGRYHVQACFRGGQRSFAAWHEKLKEHFNCALWVAGGTPWLKPVEHGWNNAVKYCSKEDDPTFLEQLCLWNIRKTKQGRRTDLEDMQQAAKRVATGEWTMNDLYNDRAGFAGMMKYGANMTKFLEHGALQRVRDRTNPTRAIWFHGTTGQGKTYAALQFCLERGYTEDQIYWWPLGDNGWADTYNNLIHKVIIMDELRADQGSHVKIDALCRLIDWTPTALRRRAREPMPVTAEWVIITGPEDPDMTFAGRSHLGDKVDQLLRRIYVRKVISQAYHPLDLDSDPLDSLDLNA